MNNQSHQATVTACEATPDKAGSDCLFPALSCQLVASKLTCLVGPNRSQLRKYLLMLAGVTKPATGTVEIFGQSIAELNHLQWRKLRCQVGYLSGAAPLQLGQNGLMNVMLPALYHLNKPLPETIGKARALLNKLNCQFAFTAFPAQLSGLQKAQLALACALILDPALLILDAPFHGLWVKERDKMGELLANYQHKRTICMIGGLQHPHFLADHARQIIYISEHKVMRFNSWDAFLLAEDPDVKEIRDVL